MAAHRGAAGGLLNITLGALTGGCGPFSAGTLPPRARQRLGEDGSTGPLRAENAVIAGAGAAGDMYCELNRQNKQAGGTACLLRHFARRLYRLRAVRVETGRGRRTRRLVSRGDEHRVAASSATCPASAAASVSFGGWTTWREHFATGWNWVKIHVWQMARACRG